MSRTRADVHVLLEELERKAVLAEITLRAAEIRTLRDTIRTVTHLHPPGDATGLSAQLDSRLQELETLRRAHDIEAAVEQLERVGTELPPPWWQRWRRGSGSTHSGAPR